MKIVVEGQIKVVLAFNRWPMAYTTIRQLPALADPWTLHEDLLRSRELE